MSLFPPEPAPEPLLCWLWLAHTLGAGSGHAGQVLDAFGGAQEAWEARESDAFRAAAGIPAAQRASLPGNTPEHYRAFARRCAARGIRILPYDDPDYPLAFSRIPDMPLVLYCTGDPRWLNEPATIGMVGSRKPTEYGQQAAADLGGALAKAGAVIVSGLADGLDSAGHRAAVREHCPTIGVLGVPIDRTYPASNRELRRQIERKGCVISEYPPESEPVGRNGFLQRNRLIAALSSALVVVEAQEKSGTMSTVNHAERYGKPVYAVPGSIFSPNSQGTNALLREGPGRGGTGEPERPAHGSAAGHPDEAGTLWPGALSAGKTVYSALKSAFLYKREKTYVETGDRGVARKGEDHWQISGQGLRSNGQHGPYPGSARLAAWH